MVHARVPVFGPTVDDETRCVHWHAETDVVAMRFACCDRYYPCFDCHAETADHPSTLWPLTRFDEPAVLCGVCGTELTATAYRAVSAQASPSCPSCAALFNAGCALHAPLYFESPPPSLTVDRLQSRASARELRRSTNTSRESEPSCPNTPP